MRRAISLILTWVLVAGCSSGGSGSAGSAPSAGIPGGAEPSVTIGVPAASLGQPAGHRPSGAKVRIVNAYTPLNGDAGPIDIYAAPWVDGGTPLLSVPYGTVSEFFDPTVADDEGDMFLSAYWAGTTGNGNELISQTETLKGGEAITFIVTTGSSTQESGRRFGAIQTFFQEASGGTFGQPTPAPGKALLVVDSNGIDQVLSAPDSSTWFFSTGNGCTKGIGDDEFTLTGAGPGSAGTYQLDPGTYAGSIHPYAKDSGEFPTCDNPALLANLAIQAVADQTAILLIYAPKDGDLRTLFIPLDG